MGRSISEENALRITAEEDSVQSPSFLLTSDHPVPVLHHIPPVGDWGLLSSCP